MKKISKIVVFDLDETLGYFTELGMLWDTIQHYFNHDLGQLTFNKLCDLYPEFFRPHIFTILKFLVMKNKKSNKNKVMIIYFLLSLKFNGSGFIFGVSITM